MPKKKKTLLEEGTVRQFMKLANLKPLTSGFVDKLYEGELHDESAEKKEEERKKREEEERKKERVKKEKKKSKPHLYKALQEDDAADDDWGGNAGDESETDPGHTDYEGDPIGDEDDGGDVDIHSLVRAIAGAIESETGVSVDVAEEEEEADLEDLEDVEDVEDEEGLEDTAALDDEEVDLGDEPELDDLEEVVSTIAENVTKRLQRMAAKSKKKSV